jgi:putative ABC transport system permease protein
VLVGDIQTMQQRISKFLAYPRFRAVLLAVFAGLALLLAAVGLYGVLAQSVWQRTQEIGIRMALGAQKSDVTGLVVKQAMLLVAGGLVVGLASAIALGRYLASLLYGVKPTDPIALGAVALALIVAALLATYIPARRASQVDPMVALRYE